MGKEDTNLKNDKNENEDSLMNGELHWKIPRNGKTLTVKRFRQRIKEDKTFRTKFLIFVSICFSFFILVSNISRMSTMCYT